MTTKKPLAFVLITLGFLATPGPPSTFLSAETGPAAPAATIDSVTFEIDAAETTVKISTSRPVPRYTCDLKDGQVVVRFPGAVSRLERQYAAPVAYLGAIQVERESGGSGGVVLRMSPRATTLGGVELREDGIALRFPAAAEEGAASNRAPAGRDASREYLVGPGDKLEVSVFGHEDLTRNVEVRADGSVNFPLLGDVAVAGKGARQIADELAARLGSEFLVDPRVSVEVREYRSHWVTVLGEVKAPGRYPLRSNMRLLDVIAEAGGPTKDAGRQLLLTTPGSGETPASEQLIGLQDVFKAGETSANPRLTHGDVITVLERELFYIRGEVNRPSAYVLENGMTLVKAIAIAGGLTPFASRKEIQVLRTGKGAAGQERLTLNLKSIEDGKREDLLLKSEDVIIVPRRIF